MVRRAGKRALMALVVAGCLLPALGSGGTVVLCLGADGHVAVETGARGNCCDSFSGRGAPAACPAVKGKTTSGLLPCGSCVDIPLFTDHTATVPGVERNPPGSGEGSRSVSLPGTPGSIPDQASGPRPVSRPSFLKSAAALLSTTVLLI